MRLAEVNSLDENGCCRIDCLSGSVFTDFAFLSNANMRDVIPHFRQGAKSWRILNPAWSFPAAVAAKRAGRQTESWPPANPGSRED
jgi:hypothetical protein